MLCPTKCVVAWYLFSSAKTGASASRECNSCEGVGDGDVLAHEPVSLFDSFRHGKSGYSRRALFNKVDDAIWTP